MMLDNGIVWVGYIPWGENHANERHHLLISVFFIIIIIMQWNTLSAYFVKVEDCSMFNIYISK